MAATGLSICARSESRQPCRVGRPKPRPRTPAQITESPMSFTVSGLPVETFAPLFGLSDEALAERGVVRQTALAGERFPCRVTLEDAPAGQSVLLLNYQHQDAATPYRSNY